MMPWQAADRMPTPLPAPRIGYRYLAGGKPDYRDWVLYLYAAEQ